ncbi:hypothetical protein [Anaeromyxobacter oryzae]|uniref:Uncharacterized protein n=1 Tax=Anaeromyxobacter oryzae TaxID=2918170 RepID=A0ABM7WRM4_9BACT|nr:hypothetical protein [Anaeromyxobacter oryzae]BDG02127.1 hypothetical protein AMOR_11230 [Anaeromyxobacter oryzae]
MAEVLERGELHFFYRPRVERNAPRGDADVQRFMVVLAPDGRRIWRLVFVGAKRMPELARRGRERNWAWVAKVAGDPGDIEMELRGYRYRTKTRGERDQPSARPAGDGEYVLARHGDHTHLAYALARPDPPGDVQRGLGIATQASYVVAVKNPEWPSPRPDAGLGEEQTAFYPRALQEKFRNRRWGEVEPAHLDRDGAELLLVGATEDPEGELGIHLDPAERGAPDAFRALGLDRRDHPVAPLFTGEWA